MTRHETLRWVRALTLACVMLAGGLSGHVAAGGVAPPAALLGPILLVLMLAVSPFLDAPASSARVVALVLGVQVTLHVVLDVVARPADPHGSMPMPLVPAHHHTGPHLVMVAAHVAAALLVALWLAAGERAAWTLVGVVGLALADAWGAIRYVFSAAPAVTASLRPGSTIGGTSPRHVAPSVWEGRGGLTRRGPPYACATA